MGMETQESIVVPARTENLHRVREFMTRQVKASALADAEKNKVVLAVDEAVANIIRHAYKAVGTGDVQIEVRSSDTRFEISIFDTGSKFDPGTVQDPDMKEHIRLGKKTGLGIFLMRQIMDEVTYTFEEGRRNELHLVKFVVPPAGGENPAPRAG